MIESRYAALFKSKKGNVAKPCRMALGALLIQKEYGFIDVKTVCQIQENRYFQFFIGLPGYQEETPFDASSMTYFRKRLDATLAEITSSIIDFNAKKDDKEPSSKKNDDNDIPDSGTLMVDATCTPQNIKSPTDTDLLNDARLHSEEIMDELCAEHSLKKPRVYRKKARQVYLSIVRRKKKPSK